MPKNRLDSFGNQSVTGVYDETSLSTGSLMFNRTLSQYLSVPHSTALDLSSGDFTIECWVYFDSVDSGSVFNKDGVFSAAYPQYTIGFASAGNLVFELGNGNGVSPTSTTYTFGTVVTGQWYHVAGVKTGSTIKTFLNGTQVTSTAQVTAMTNGSKPLIIGYQTSQPSSAYFNGSISNLRILKGTALYTASFTAPTLPLEPITNTSLLLKTSTPSTAIIDSSITPATISNTNNVGFNYQSPFNDTPCGSISFNGSSQYLNVANNAALYASTSDFTTEAWVLLNAVDSTQRRFFSQQAPGSSTVYWVGVSTTNKFTSEIRGSGGAGDTQIYGTTTPVVGTWYHVAFTRSGTNTYLFVNGILEASSTGQNQSIGTSSTGIGAYYNPGGVGSPGDYWNGYITNLRHIVGTAVYTANFTPPTRILQPVTNTQLLLQVASSAAFVTDSSINAFTVTNNGTAVYKQFAPITAVRQRVTNDGSMLLNTAIDEVTLSTGSLNFNGSNQYLTLASNAAFGFGTGDFTIETWINLQAAAGSGGNNILDFRTSATATPWTIYVKNTGGGNYIGSYTSAGSTGVEAQSGLLSLNTWYHVAITRTSGTWRIFLNGVNQTLTGSGYDGNLGSSNPVTIGAAVGGSAYLNCSLSNLRILKGTALYTVSFTPSTQPLEAVSNTSLLLKSSTLASAITDSSTNAFTMTNNGNVAFNYQSLFNTINNVTTVNSISFNGSSQYLTVPAGSAFAYGTGDFTVEGWVNFSTLAGNPLIFSQTVSGTNYFLVGIDSASSRIGFTFATSGGGTNIFSATTVTTNQWYHFAVVRSSGNVKVYVNGIGGTATACAQNFTDTTYVPTIGRYTHTASQYFGGYISNFRIVKGTAVYTSNFALPSYTLTNITNTSLLLQTASSATFLTDSSTNAFTVTNNGTATFAQVSDPTTGPCGSLLLNGSSQYLSCSNSVFNFTTSNWTVEAWVYLNAMPTSDAWPTNYSQHMVVAGVGTPSVGDGMDCIIGQTKLMIQNNDTQYAGTAHGMAINTWYHLAYVRNGNTIFFYVNGDQKGSVAFSGAIGTGASTYIGCETGQGAFLNGYITNLRVINGTAVYTRNFTPPTTVLQPITNTSLLLQVANQPLAIADSSTNGFVVTNNNTAVYRQFAPLTGPKQRLDVSGTHYVANTYDEVSLNNGSAYFPNSSFCYTATMPSLNSNNFTIESWVNLSNTTTEAPLVKYFATDIIELRLVNGKLTSYYNNGSATISNGSTLANNLWYHVALVRNGSTLTQYLNGTSDGTPATISGTSNATSVYIARNQSTGGGNAFNGSMAKLRISNTAVYTTNFTPTTQPFVANSSTQLLMFNEANSTNLNTNLGLDSTVSVANVGVVPFNYQSPNNDQPCGSISFNGSSQYLSLAANSNYNITSGDFTVECWIYRTVSGAEQYLWSSRSDSPSSGWEWRINSTNLMQFFFTGGSSLTSTSTIPANAWTHLAVTRETNTVRFFINGVLDSTATFSNGTAVSGVGLLIGYGTTGGGLLTGSMTNARIVKGTALYTANFTPPTTVLQPITNTALLLQVANSSTFTTDSSTNAFTVTNNGTALYKQFSPLAN
jgi:Concanavalin A-like lectin/glucanases superfamily